MPYATGLELQLVPTNCSLCKLKPMDSMYYKSIILLKQGKKKPSCLLLRAKNFHGNRRKRERSALSIVVGPIIMV